MHGVERRAALIGKDADRIDHHVDAFQPREPRVRVDVLREVDRDVGRAGRLTHAAQHTMAAGFELRAQCPPDEAVRPAHENGHAARRGAASGRVDGKTVSIFILYLQLFLYRQK